MTWTPTAGLVGAVLVAAVGLGIGLLTGRPAAVVLAAPFVVWSVCGLRSRPAGRSGLPGRLELDDRVLVEGQGTTSRLVAAVPLPATVEHVTRQAGGAAHVAVRPARRTVGGLVASGLPTLVVSPRRWGRRSLGEEKVAWTSRWAGYRLGPTLVDAGQLDVLPAGPAYDSRAEAPHPVGLVGAHRSVRLGDGTEFADIRGFQAGDRLRRLNWRVSLRTGALHVETTRSEEDAGVLLVVDALADHGRSEGVDGLASSLDVGVRAAAALAEHVTRTGDRVGLRVVGRGGEHVPPGAGSRHLRRVRTVLSRLQVGEPHDLDDDPLRLRVTAGTVVVVLSALLHPAMVTTVVSLARRGLAVTVVDTLPADAEPAVAEGTDPRVAALAWRLRLLERGALLAQLTRTGCPVVAWSGPGTLDEVLRRLARRARAPRVSVRAVTR